MTFSNILSFSYSLYPALWPTNFVCILALQFGASVNIGNSIP